MCRPLAAVQGRNKVALMQSEISQPLILQATGRCGPKGEVFSSNAGSIALFSVLLQKIVSSLIVKCCLVDCWVFFPHLNWEIFLMPTCPLECNCGVVFLLLLIWKYPLSSPVILRQQIINTNLKIESEHLLETSYCIASEL